jgi:hypothetical protein
LPAALLGVSELSPGMSTKTSDLSALRPSEPGRVRKLEFFGRSGAYEARGTIVLTSTATEPEAEPAVAEETPIDEPSEQTVQPG